MQWWLWMLFGMVLAILELQAPGSFFLLGIGLSAIAVGAIEGIGVGVPAWLQWLLFSLFAVVTVVLLRRYLRGKPAHWTSEREIDSLVGQEVVIADEVPVGGVGKAELRGSIWSARSATNVTLAKGRRCRVVRVEGLTLWLGSE